MAKSEETEKKPVEVSAESFVSMVLHAGQNSATVVHGILLGSFKNDKVSVTKAIPVCHETPTKPLLETAMGLVEASSSDDEVVVGWYTAPERIKEDQPGPVALRIAASMANGVKEEPVLILLNNEAVAACLVGGRSSKEKQVLTPLGKDFGQQWLEPLSCSIKSEAPASEAAASAFQDGLKVVDLVDHFEGATQEWLKNTALSKHVARITS